MTDAIFMLGDREVMRLQVYEVPRAGDLIALKLVIYKVENVTWSLPDLTATVTLVP